MFQQRKRSRSSSSGTDDDEPERKRQKLEDADAMGEAKAEHKQYPAKLVEFLKPLSRCQNDNHAMFSEWNFTHTHDRGQSGELCCSLPVLPCRLMLRVQLTADGECPCTHKHIRYECHIRNSTTRRTAFVGTECINWFPDGERMHSCIKIADSLMRSGLEGTYKVSRRALLHCGVNELCACAGVHQSRKQVDICDTLEHQAGDRSQNV
jgi:hypothetical protein